jgi:ABC-type phosphate/phosphonate transport system substrate-binding protein
VVALLDQTQADALPTLPFAAELKVVGQSPPLPVAIIAIVDSRVPAARAKSLQAALLKMGHGGGAGADTLSALRLQGFVMPQVPRPAPAP